MTWNSPDGERLIAGREAILLREAIHRLVDELADDADWESDRDEVEKGYLSGAAIFDQLTLPEKIGMLLLVAEHLFLPTPETLKLTAVSESTVSAIYNVIQQEIEIEIDFGPLDCNQEESELPTWRAMTWNAWNEWRERHFDHDADAQFSEAFPRDKWCLEINKWSSVIDCLADRILWDRDFEMIDRFMDANPEVARRDKQLLGLDEDYFTAVAPEIQPHKLHDSINAIRKLLHQKPQ